MTDTPPEATGSETTADLFGIRTEPEPKASRAAGLAGLVRPPQPPAPRQPAPGGEQQAPHVLLSQPTPIDPATITGTPEERLAKLEAAIERADAAASESVRYAKARHIIEVGTALRIIHNQDLATTALGMTWTQYVTERRQMSLSRSYQYMEAAPALTRVWASKILEAPPNESQAMALDPIIETHGKEAAQATIDKLRQSGKKPTKAAIESAAKELGYLPPARPSEAQPTDGEDDDIVDAEVIDDERAPLIPLQDFVAQLKQADKTMPLKAAKAALAAVPDEAEKLLTEAHSIATRLAKRAARR